MQTLPLPAPAPFLLLILFPLLLLASCAPAEDQIQFEQDAMRPPANFTATDERGIVLSEDPDDWRIGPMFYRLVTVNPIYPNPTSGNDLRLQVYVERTEALFGIEVLRYNPFGQQRYISLYRNTMSPLPAGLMNINIPFNVMFPEYPAQDVRGLHRILIYDNRDNLVSYGDLMLQ